MTSNPLKPNDPRLRWNRSKYTIRGQKDTTTPHSSCPICYLDATSTDTTTMLEFRCARGHTWLQTRKTALEHATFVARLYIGPER